jgi:hypothetical protein
MADFGTDISDSSVRYGRNAGATRGLTDMDFALTDRQAHFPDRTGETRAGAHSPRRLCLKAADMMDRAGNKAAQNEIAMVNVQAPTLAVKILDEVHSRAIARAECARYAEHAAPRPQQH